ncbi:hypothetical protein ACFFRR_002975 [Megaselia abdita]
MQSTRLILYLIVVSVLCGFVCAEDWSVQFFPKDAECFMGRSVQVNVTINSTENSVSDFVFISEFSKLAEVGRIISTENQSELQLDIDCHLLGMSEIYVDYGGVKLNNTLKVIIMKEMKFLDQMFSVTVALVITFLYINFGAALDFDVLKDILKKPVGPSIGFLCQYGLMPLLGFVLGYLIFPNEVHFRLGLFFISVAPGGGTSNIFTVILDGNINLSIAMTTISNIAALGMMPFWIFTLGAIIFEDFHFEVPYATVAIFCCGMVIPLCIGMAIQKYLPVVSKFLVRILKPVSIILMLWMTIIGIWSELEIFPLFTWKIMFAGMGLPWTAYLISWCVAKIFKQSNRDALTIALEAGIQNIVIAIFLLRFTLPQPYQDLAILIPGCITLMGPLPLLILLVVKKCVSAFQKEEKDEKYAVIPQNIKAKELEIVLIKSVRS